MSDGLGRLQGRFRVRRTSGVLPPLPIAKRIAGARGWTLVGRVPVLPFRLRALPDGSVELRYRGPLGFLRDRLVATGDAGAFAGTARAAGLVYCHFRLDPLDPLDPLDSLDRLDRR